MSESVSGFAWLDESGPTGVLEEPARLAECLEALELARIGVTATVEASGRLGPVGGLWPKLLAAALASASLGLLRVVVVADGQPDVPPALLADDAFPLRVVRAGNLRDAVARLYAADGPRFALRRRERQQSSTLDVLGLPVPLEAHYIPLPLRPEFASPHSLEASEFEGKPGLPSSEGATRDAPTSGDDRRQWPSLTEPISRTVTVEQLLSDFRSMVGKQHGVVPRLVVLGPPGSGKTTLLKHLAWRAAGGELRAGGRPVLPVRLRLREWEEWAAEPGRRTATLPDYLAHRHRDLPQAPSAARWRRWLERGETLLLLDGLDEVTDPARFGPVLKSAVGSYAECPMVLTCRTMSFERHREACLGIPVFSLAGLEKAQRDGWIRAFPAEGPGRFDPEALIARLDRLPRLAPLAGNPLLLSILCHSAQAARDEAVPATPARLFEQMVTQMLARPRGTAIRYRGANFDMPLTRRLRILEFAALSLLADAAPEQPWSFAEADWVDALSTAAARDGYREERARIGDTLLRDLTQNSGLLQGRPERGLSLLHPAIHEHLAASALAALVNDAGVGWHTAIRMGRQVRSVQDLVDHKAWHPAWAEVIVALAGRLDDPAPLLGLLTDASRDDVFRHRLALAARCLPEIRSAWRVRRGDTLDRITTMAFLLWWQHRLNNTTAAVSHLTCALSALGLANGRLGHVPLIEWCRQRLRSEDACLRLAALSATENLGEDAATPELLAGVADRLRDGDSRVRMAAAQVLGRLGRLPDGQAVLTRLVAGLGDADWGVRRHAAQAIGRWGRAADTAEILARLATLLKYGDETQREAAAQSVSYLGQSAATPEILALLADRLSDDSRAVRAAARIAVGRVGSGAASPESLAALLDHLRDPSPVDRRAAAEALGHLGRAAGPELPARLCDLAKDANEANRAAAALSIGELREAAASPEVLAGLASLLLDEAGPVRAAAAEAVARIGRPAASPDVLARLSALLLDPQRDVQHAAAKALGRLGQDAARPEFLTRLAGLLGGEGGVRPQVRWAAVKAIGALGRVAATPEIVARFPDLLGDEDWRVRMAAAQAVTRLGAAAATPAILSGLEERLIDADREVQAKAIGAVGALGAAAATPELLLRLAKLLRHEAEPLRDAALEAIGGLGQAAATPAFVSRLLALSRDESRAVRAAAAQAMGRLGHRAAWPEVLAGLAERLDDADGWVRESAAQAAGRLGRAAATPEILTRLLAQLHASAGSVRTAAAEALQRMSSQGVRVFAAEGGVRRGRHVSELGE